MGSDLRGDYLENKIGDYHYRFHLKIYCASMKITIMFYFTQ